MELPEMEEEEVVTTLELAALSVKVSYGAARRRRS
jgi:hypothetical protein